MLKVWTENRTGFITGRVSQKSSYPFTGRVSQKSSCPFTGRVSQKAGNLRQWKHRIGRKESLQRIIKSF